MEIKEKDFIELEFTGKTQEGEIFDSNIREDLDKSGLRFPAKPFSFSLGQNMFLKGIEDFLVGKEIGKDYAIELSPEKAFGSRNPSLIRLVPVRVFREKNLNPQVGAAFNFDGNIGRVISVSGGRIMVDFNNPLAGKPVIYNVKVTRKVENNEEKVKSLLDFFFRRDFDFEIKENNIVLSLEKEFHPIFKALEKKFQEILNLNLELKEKSKEKTPQNDNKKKDMNENKNENNLENKKDEKVSDKTPIEE